MGQERCGMWMPRKKTTCARTSGHGGPCKTAETMERNRLYNRDHPHRESRESRKKSNRKYRISSYGLTPQVSQFWAGTTVADNPAWWMLVSGVASGRWPGAG